MATFCNALDKHTPKIIGEKNHIEYSWSIVMDEKINQFFFQLVRSNNHSDLEHQLHLILSNMHHSMQIGMTHEKLHRFTMMYKLIGQTRDIVGGKGECQLAYMQIFIWWQYFPELALNAFTHFVFQHNKKHPYGSWKDIKYMCNYVQERMFDKSHPLIEHGIGLMVGQLKNDWRAYISSGASDASKEHHGPGQEKKSPEKILSLAARWAPREPNYKKKKNTKFGWLYTKLAVATFPEFLIYVTPENKVSWKNATLKCKIHFKKRIVILNKALNTVQIKQCNQQYATINFNHVTSQTLRRQRYAFQNKTKRGAQRKSTDDRVLCAQNFTSHIAAAKLNSTEHKMHGKRCSCYELVKDAINVGDMKMSKNKDDRDVINLQWEDNSKNNKGLAKVPIISMVDTSGSMENDDCIPLYNAIGLGIRTSEISHPVFKNRILTFDHIPQWINLDDCDTFYDKVWKIKNAAWNTSTNIYKAFKLILDVCVEKCVPPHEIEGMIIAVFSDMQIDNNCVTNCPRDNEPLALEIQRMYNSYGYTAPHLLFWNLRKTSGFPTLSTTQNITTLSGYNSTLLNIFCDKGLDALKNYTPCGMLGELLGNERYDVMEEDLMSFLNN